MTILGAILLLCTFFLLTYVRAQSLPHGSYKKTCRGYYVEGNRLYAQCKTRKGNWYNTSINFKNCAGDIWNDNGELNCTRQSNLPKGGYKETCRDYYVEGNKLEAQCKTRKGNWYNTSINFKNCAGDIWNDNGQLSCTRQSNLPKGSYKETCRDYYAEGNRLDAQCKMRNGAWKYTSINFRNCKGDIWNDNGQLKCN